MKALLDGFFWGIGIALGLSILGVAFSYVGPMLLPSYFSDYDYAYTELDNSSYEVFKDVLRFVPLDPASDTFGQYRVSGQLEYQNEASYKGLDVRVSIYNGDGVFLETCSSEIDVNPNEPYQRFKVDCYETYSENEVVAHKYNVFGYSVSDL